jgi:hypothetical protein
MLMQTVPSDVRSTSFFLSLIAIQGIPEKVKNSFWGKKFPFLFSASGLEIFRFESILPGDRDDRFRFSSRADLNSLQIKVTQAFPEVWLKYSLVEDFISKYPNYLGLIKSMVYFPPRDNVLNSRGVSVATVDLDTFVSVARAPNSDHNIDDIAEVQYTTFFADYLNHGRIVSAIMQNTSWIPSRLYIRADDNVPNSMDYVASTRIIFEQSDGSHWVLPRPPNIHEPIPSSFPELSTIGLNYKSIEELAQAKERSFQNKELIMPNTARFKNIANWNFPTFPEYINTSKLIASSELYHPVSEVPIYMAVKDSNYNTIFDAVDRRLLPQWYACVTDDNGYHTRKIALRHEDTKDIGKFGLNIYRISGIGNDNVIPGFKLTEMFFFDDHVKSSYSPKDLFFPKRSS